MASPITLQIALLSALFALGLVDGDALASAFGPGDDSGTPVESYARSSRERVDFRGSGDAGSNDSSRSKLDGTLASLKLRSGSGSGSVVESAREAAVNNGVDHAVMSDIVEAFPGSPPTLELTGFGRSIRTLVIAAVVNERVCEPGNTDWRSSLPRFFARVLARVNANVLVWHESKAARFPGYQNDCSMCLPSLNLASYGHARQDDGVAFSCHGWLDDHGIEIADAVLILGTGNSYCNRTGRDIRPCIPEVQKHDPFGELRWIFDQPWVGNTTRFMHIPISRDERILQNEIGLPVDKVLLDGDWVKPTHIDDVRSFRKWCSSIERNNTLLYIARYKSFKGQVAFLNAMDPRLLGGYTVEFLSSSINKHRAREIEEAAAARGINAKVHREGLSREQLQSVMCSAKGTVHFAAADANPRVLYESILAGLPVFITAQSRFPQVMHNQRFVHVTDFDDTAKANEDFARFLRFLETEDPGKLRQEMYSAADRELEEDHALSKVCSHFGICTGPGLEASPGAAVGRHLRE